MDLRAQFLREIAKTRLAVDPGPAAPVTPADLEPLPEPARRYLRFMGAVGRPRDWSFRIGFDGFFRLRPHQRFSACEAWSYANRLSLARFFRIRMRLGRIVPMTGRDSYVDGQGRMLIRLADLLTVENGTGAAYDSSELVSYLNDAVLIAPSMLLVPDVAWTAVDGRSFGVAITDHGCTIGGRVMVDERGAPIEFTTTDRYYTDPDDPAKVQRTRWTTPVEGWEVIDGRAIFRRAEARWHLPQGLFTYADLRPIPGSLAFNMRPGE